MPIIYRAPEPHRCSPPTGFAGHVMYPVDTVWQCDQCEQTWVVVYGDHLVCRYWVKESRLHRFFRRRDQRKQEKNPEFE